MNNNKGASSVLVIIMMIVLIILGLAIATTSISNRKLSEKKTKWLLSYYELSGKAEIKISEIDSIINESKNSASSNESYKTALEENLKKLDAKIAMPHAANHIGSCNISFKIAEKDSPFNKHIFVNMLVPLDLDYEGNLYQITNYQLIQEPLVKEEMDEFKDDPFENMD